MSNPVSLPAAPPQPDQQSYGIDSLALFKTYTRESYRQAFGVEPPPWNPSRLTKTWFDSSVDTASVSPVSYKAVARDAGGNWTLQTFSLAAAEAATVNLPGAIAYPPYVIAPTGATRGGSPINPLFLSLESDARGLLAPLGAVSIVDQGATPVFPVVYPPDELRRMWAIVRSSGQQINVGALLQERNASGVGAPGRWDLSGVNPVWVSDPPAPSGLDDKRPPVPMPVRDLLPNEELRLGPMGFGVQVVRTDLEQAAMRKNGAFTEDDRKKLDEIYRIVSRLGI
jgi:hypothetical protein